MVKWFESLKKHKVEIKLSELPEETEEAVEEVKEEPIAEETWEVGTESGNLEIEFEEEIVATDDEGEE